MTFADGTAESKVTLQMAKILKDRLLAEGYDVLMTVNRTTSSLIYCQDHGTNNADCHIALHWTHQQQQGLLYMSVKQCLLQGYGAGGVQLAAA